MSEIYEMNIDEIEKYIIGKKIKDMSLEEIKNFIETQGNTIILNHHIYEKQQLEIERLNNKLKDIKSQLDYLETYSSKEDVFEDMKRRLDRIDKIIGSDKE